MARIARAFPSHNTRAIAPTSNVNVVLGVASSVAPSLFRGPVANLQVASAVGNTLNALKLKSNTTLSIASSTASSLLTATGHGRILSVTSSTVSSVLKPIKKWVNLGNLPNKLTYVNDVVASSPVHYWRFNENGTNTTPCYDQASGFYITTTGSVMKNAAGLIAGCNDGGLQFTASGVGTGTSNVTLSTFQNHDFTVEFWMYPTQLNASRFVVAVGTQNNPGTDNFLHIGAIGSNKLRFGFFGDDMDSNATLSPYNLYHVVCTWQASNKAKIIYINGAVDSSTTSSGAFSVRSDASMQLGTITFSVGNGPYSYDGVVSQLAIYPSVLSANTVAQHYTDGTTGVAFVAPTSPPGGPVNNGGIPLIPALQKRIGKNLGETSLLTPIYITRSKVVMSNFDGGLTAPLSATTLPIGSTTEVDPGLFRTSPPKGKIKVQFKTFILSIINRTTTR